jgi:hypothetical protein
MDQPENLVGMVGEVGRKFGGDHQIDRFSVGLGQVQHAPDFDTFEELIMGVPFVRDVDEVDLIIPVTEVIHQTQDMRLGSSLEKGDLGGTHGNGSDR